MSASTVYVSEASDKDRSDWDALVAASDGAEIYHYYEWRSLFESVFGHRCIYLIARNSDGRVLGLLPLVHLKSRVFGNFLVSVPCINYCGVLADRREVGDALIEAASGVAADLGADHVELRHRGDADFDLPSRQDKVSMRLSVPASDNELWNSFTPKLRAQIRRPTKEGATCEEGGGELLDSFYDVFSRNMRDLGTPVYPRNLFEEVCQRFSQATRVFVIRMDDRPVAAGLTIGYRRVLEIPWASSLREFNRYSPNMLLYWSVLKYAVRSGFEWFDFGRTTIDSGPYRFKKQWGTEQQSLAWHYILKSGGEMPRLNPDNAKYQLAIRLWRKLPVTVANVIGPRVVRNLP